MSVWRLVLTLLLLLPWDRGAEGAALGRTIRVEVARTQTAEAVATRYFGDPRAARAVLAANGLTFWGRRLPRLRKGRRLVLPTAWGYRIQGGDRWAELARLFLGDASQGEFLARLSGKRPELPPPPGHVILVPALVDVRVPPRGGVGFLAGRLLGLPVQAQAVRKLVRQIRAYNHLRGRPSPRQRLVVPLSGLRLLAWYLPNTPPVKSGSATRRAREALARGQALLRRGDFLGALAATAPALGSPRVEVAVRVALFLVRTTAWVAVNRMGLARSAARAALALEPSLRLDAALVSPKVRAVFARARAAARGSPR